jgi:sugar lactone lactonase YvrE
MARIRFGTWISGAVCLIALLGGFAVCSQADPVGFESGQWVVFSGQVTEHLGRTCLAGSAYLKDVDFRDGVIEVDLLVTDVDRKSYPGINFHVQSQTDYERFYVRPHRAPIYPDALQYTPSIRGIAGWQLYSGAGFTAEAGIPENEWIHIRLEVLGTRARVFVGDSDRPGLVIDELKHGASGGTISLIGSDDGTTYFSDFAFREDSGLQFPPAAPADTVPGMITEWEISQPFKISKIDPEKYPQDQDLPEITWQRLVAEPSGLVDVARYTGRLGNEPDCVIARATIQSDSDHVKQYAFGYSDWIGVFLNGEILFSANSSYQGRDPSFLGIVGLNDVLYLPLKQGANELLITVAEGFGGWGFIWQDPEVVYERAGVSKVWETGEEFKVPESIAYDEERDALYVSNYDAYVPSYGAARQFISKVSMDGTGLEPEWAGGLNNPTGMAVSAGRLFVVERAGVVEIDTGSGTIATRHALPEPGFPNDIAIDDEGNIYVSDSRKSVIYRSAGGEFVEWMAGEEIADPNGLHAFGGTLYVGSNGNRSLKGVDLATGQIRVVATFRNGIIDGIDHDRDGNLVVSHWDGRVYRVSPSGDAVKLLDTTGPGLNCADIEYVAERDVLVVPTFVQNKVSAYQVARP